MGVIQPNAQELQTEIDRLRRRNIVELEQVKILHDWLDGKPTSRQSGRVVGESRTGKTVACDAYRLRHKPIQVTGQPPVVPVAYIQIPQECSSKELFGVIIEDLKYQMTKGTVAEIRDRTLRVGTVSNSGKVGGGKLSTVFYSVCRNGEVSEAFVRQNL